MDTRERGVRPAVLADAADISRVHVDAWRETYSGMVPDSYFSEGAFERRKAWWAQQLSATPAVGRIVVAFDGDAIVGFASSGPAVGREVEKGFPAVRPINLHTIYLLAAEHGTGLGQALLEGAIGDEPAQLWVAAENARAIAFYERNGFRADGIEYVDPSIDNLLELRMVR